MQLAVAFSPLTLLGGLLPRVAMMAGGAALTYALGPKKDQNEGRLQDLKVASSTYGRGITNLFGSMSVSGNIIWSTEIEEKKTYVGAKGKQKGSSLGSKLAKKGKADVVWEYYGNFGVGLCAGPKGGLLRLWADGNLIYDAINPKGYYDSNGIWVPVVDVGFSQDDGSSDKNKNTKKAPNRGRFEFRFYGGTESQLQDPYMVKIEGEGNVPAYRGLCYLMFEHFPLLDFGNRIPQITAEVTDFAERDIQAVRWIELPVGEAGGIAYPQSLQNENLRAPLAMLNMFDGYLYNSFSPTATSRGIQVWDVQLQKEIKRMSFPAALNPDGNMALPTFLGFDHDGNIILSYAWHVFPSSLGRTTYAFQKVNPRTGSGINWTYPSPIGSALSDGLIAPPVRVDASYIYDLGVLTAYYYGQTFEGDLRGSFGPTIELFHPSVPILVDSDIFGLGASINPGYPPSGVDHWVIKAPYIYGITAGLLSVTVDLRAFGSSEYAFQHVAPPIWSIQADAFLLIFSTFSDGGYFAKMTGKGKFIWVKKSPVALVIDTEEQNTIPVISGTKFSYVGGNAASNWAVTLNLADANPPNYTPKDAPVYTFSNVELIDLPAIVPRVDITGNSPQFYLENENAVIYRGIGGLVGSAPAGSGWYTLYLDKFRRKSVLVKNLIRERCVAAGMTDAELDFTQLSDIYAIGYRIENPTPVRATIDELAQLYFFDVVESDYKLKFVSRETAAVAAVIYAVDLGIVGGSSGSSGSSLSADADNSYEETRHQEIDLPRVANVSFIDPNREFQVGGESYSLPTSPFPLMQSREQIEINTPVAMSPQLAKQYAEKIITAVWMERGMHKLSLATRHIALDPTDVVEVRFDSGLRFVDRIIQSDLGGNLVVDVETVFVTEPFYTTPTAPTSLPRSPYLTNSVADAPGGVISFPPTSDPSGKIFMIDAPYIEDGDAITSSVLPMYWGIGAKGPGFAAGSFSAKTSNADFQSYGGTSLEVVWGTVSGIVPAPPDGPHVTDFTTALTLYPAYDYETEAFYDFESLLDSEWPSDANLIYVDGEYISFKNVAYNADGSVTVSMLLRGVRGTDTFALKHIKNGPEFVLMKGEGVNQAKFDNTVLDNTIFGKAVTGNLLSNVTQAATTIQFRANALRPWAPAFVLRSDIAGAILVTCQRRTRLNGGFKATTAEVPVNEEREEYRWYVSKVAVSPAFDPSVDIYIREISTFTNQMNYTAAMMLADGVVVTDTIWIAVGQVSADVGLGFITVAKLETTDPVY